MENKVTVVNDLMSCTEVCYGIEEKPEGVTILEVAQYAFKDIISRMKKENWSDDRIEEFLANLVPEMSTLYSCGEESCDTCGHFPYKEEWTFIIGDDE